MSGPGREGSPGAAGTSERVQSSAFLRACRREPVAFTPVWLMRQAGRYLPEYRALRERRSMVEILANPELAAEITLLPMKRFELDAAIIYADILPPLAAMGLDLSFDRAEGPVIQNPIRSARDIDLLAAPSAEETMGATLEAVRIVRSELDALGKPLIGFAGAPFTLASYAIEGGASRSYAKTKTLMLREPAAWRRLMSKLVTVQADYLLAQAKAGASALQLFDSWVGIALGAPDYERYVLPYNRRLFEALRAARVPVVNFSTGTAAYIERVAEAGGEVIGVDWRMPLGYYRERIGAERAIQGNLDPCALLAPWTELRARADGILEAAAGRLGHVFNLGHGILPETPVDAVARLVDHVHARSRERLDGDGGRK